VDVTAVLTDANGCLRTDLTRDGLHLNAEGYTILARAIRDAARARGWSL